MTKIPYFVADYYDRNVIQRIVDVYNMDEMDAARAFLLSETHELLEDAENGVWEYPERGVFDMWEAERKTGDPRNSCYVQGA